MPDADVAGLLAASKSAHAAYRRADAAKSGDAEKRIHIEHALTARQDAHTADPTHDEPEWGSETLEQHEALVSFYESWLERHPS